MAYWILQPNPDRYRIFDALSDVQALRTWTVAQHQQAITPGDEFVLWANGPSSGLYAFGLVPDPAEVQPDRDPYWEDPAEGDNPAWRIGIRITNVLERPIPRSEIAADPVLSALRSVGYTRRSKYLASVARWECHVAIGVGGSVKVQPVKRRLPSADGRLLHGMVARLGLPAGVRCSRVPGWVTGGLRGWRAATLRRRR